MKKHQKKVLIDLFLWSAATPIAYILRLDTPFSHYFIDSFWILAILLPVKFGLIYSLGFYRQSWHKIGVLDLYTLSKGILTGTGIFLCIALILRESLFIPLSVPIIEGMLAFLSLSFIRLAVRLYDEHRRGTNARKQHPDKILIAGAGEAGTMIAREMLRHPESCMQPIGFLDDNPQKRSLKFLGLPVFGPLNDLPLIAKREKIDEILIAMPSASGEVTRKVVSLARESGIDNKIIPAIHKLLNGEIKISQIRDVDVEDLLRREPVVLENQEISRYVKDRTILITGAGGSIGSELVRQVLKFNPHRLVLLDHSEYNLYQIDQELIREGAAASYHTVINDIRDYDALEHTMMIYKPDVIFHAAAHKHVPLMELNPEQALLNNVGGTKNLVELALEYNVQRFVNISTDKAVNPTSVMGTSKRIAEYVVEWGAEQTRENQVFVSVRFGNVLGSRGSVIPKFKEQIQRGGPVTVTHPEMTRYFMTIPEASQLVLQAAGQAENGCIYVLDMGEPVKILDMARDLIKLSGLEPDHDIKIVFSGIRPGEKLYEELLTAEEGTTATHHDKIFVAQKNGLPLGNFEGYLDTLFDIAAYADPHLIKSMFKQIVPSYQYEPEETHSPPAESEKEVI